jgi:hypothetical protein
VPEGPVGDVEGLVAEGLLVEGPVVDGEPEVAAPEPVELLPPELLCAVATPPDSSRATTSVTADVTFIVNLHGRPPRNQQIATTHVPHAYAFSLESSDLAGKFEPEGTGTSHRCVRWPLECAHALENFAISEPGQHQESNMSSTRDPILLLEPSNLLEPLNLADRHGDPASPSTRPDRHLTSPTSPARTQSAAAAISRHDAAREKLPDSVVMGAQRIRRDSFSSPIQRDSRWRLKSALLVAGALACVATGTALPQLPELVFGDAKPAQQTTKSAQQTAADATKPKSAQQTVANATKPSAPVADAPAKSEEPKPAEPKPNESSGSNQSVALTANPGAQPAVPDQPAPAAQDAAAAAATPCGPRNKARDDKCLEGGPATPAPEPTAVPDRNSVGAPAASRTTAANPAKQRAASQTIWELDDRTQQSVNRRATQRDTADQQATTDSNGQGARSSDRNAPDRSSPDRNASDRNSWDRDRRQDQDSSRTSSRRRERSGDNGQTVRYGDSRQEQDFNRNPNGRRDRNEDYGRDEDRRVFGRVPREDDRVIGPRHEGPLPLFPSLFGW